MAKKNEQKKTEGKSVTLNFSSFSTMQDENNPDVLNFSGVAGYVDTPTDGTPCGGIMGYKTIISSENIDVESLTGSGVNVQWSDDFFSDPAYNLKDHAPRFKVGVVDEAHLNGNEIAVAGHLWKNDFPDVCDTIESAKESLGFSVEVYFDGVMRDDKAQTLTGLGAHFTGVAILYKNKAAFQNTKFMCSMMNKENEELNEETKNALDEQQKAFDAKFSALEASIKTLTETVEKLSKVEDKAEPKQDEPKMDFAAMQDAITAGVKDAMAQALAEKKVETKEEEKEPERKTKVDFASLPRFDGEKKTAMELSKAIDDDVNLTAEQKWAKKVQLWNDHRDEFKA